MVVVMMGAMDVNAKKKKPSPWDIIDRPLSVSKAYLFLKETIGKAVEAIPFSFAWPKATSEQKREVSTHNNGVATHLVPQVNVMQFLYALHLKENNEYAKAELILRYLLSLNLDPAFLARVDSELSLCLHSQKKYEQLIPYIRRSLVDSELNSQATHWLKEICDSRILQDQVISMLNDVLAQDPDSVTINQRISQCY